MREKNYLLSIWRNAMFNTSITGINGSQKYLDTTSNNIANANSYGFKKSRAEFADLYTNSVFTSSKQLPVWVLILLL